jgi:hypothetical protein
VLLPACAPAQLHLCSHCCCQQLPVLLLLLLLLLLLSCLPLKTFWPARLLLCCQLIHLWSWQHTT